ncbi:MAG: hypothetical protein LBM38_00995 [Clostridiales bacterium]|jgi:hypothetical protein|nr:hypothetical protein [Clostridiales bacterium]
MSFANFIESDNYKLNLDDQFEREISSNIEHLKGFAALSDDRTDVSLPLKSLEISCEIIAQSDISVYAKDIFNDVLEMAEKSNVGDSLNEGCFVVTAKGIVASFNPALGRVYYGNTQAETDGGIGAVVNVFGNGYLINGNEVIEIGKNSRMSFNNVENYLDAKRRIMDIAKDCKETNLKMYFNLAVEEHNKQAPSKKLATFKQDRANTPNVNVKPNVPSKNQPKKPY